MEDRNEIRCQYDMANKKKNAVLIICTSAMIVMGLYFVTIGVNETSFKQVLEALCAWIGGRLNDGGSTENAANKIIVLMRLPRIAIAIIAGAGMAVSGTAMQAVTRNPLVSPFTMGISSASAFGASMCIVFGTGMFLKSELGIICCAFAASAVCMLIVYAFSSRAGMGPETIVLTGISLNYFFSALTSTIEFFANEHKLAAVVHWTFGTLNGTVWRDVIFSGGFVVAGISIIGHFRYKLNIMSSGDDEFAKGLGLNPKTVRAVICVVSVFMTAAIISFTGVIGFVGLVAPHIARILVGNDHKFLIPFSALTGAMLLMAADAVGKTILSPVSIPVGIVVSFLGVPLFLHLILRQRRERAE